MHITFNSAANFAYYLSHSCSMAQSVRGQGADKHTDKILIGAKKNGVAILGSNLAQSFERIIPYTEFQLHEAGAIAINAVKLLGVIKTFNNDPITLKSYKTEKNLLIKITSGKSMVNISEVVEAKDYPRTSIHFDAKSSIPIDVSILKEMMQGVLPSLSDGSHRDMRGLSLRIKNGYLSCSTVDGFRLGIAKHKLTDQRLADVNIETIIPIKAVNTISSLNSEKPEALLFLTDNSMVLKMGSLCYRTQTLDVKFPDLNSILPNEIIGSVSIDSKEFKSLLERARICINDSASADKKTPPRLEINFKTNGTLICKAVKSNEVITEEEFACHSASLNADVVSAYSYEFLNQAISVSRSNLVTINLAYTACSKDNPLALITPTYVNERFSLLSLILPLRF